MSKLKQRRKFLKQLCGLSGGAVLMGTPWAYAQADSGLDTSGHKVLVHIDLSGGNDSTNMLVPNTTAAYERYAFLRKDLALPKDQLLPINPNGMSLGEYALHPKLKGVQTLFNEGHAAFVANMGTMVDLSGKVGSPPKRGSHSNQSRFWQGVDPTRAAVEKVGWVGRIADLDSNLSGMSTSVDGKNIWQSGRQSISAPNILADSGPVKFHDAEEDMQHVADAIAADALYDDNLLVSELSRYRGNARSSLEALDKAMNTPFINELMQDLSLPKTKLGIRFTTILRGILAGTTSGVPRQTFYLRQGGYDTHSAQLARQESLYEELDTALYAFQTALHELGLADQVTTFTSSEFGRKTLTNGTGTGHGWGGHQMIIGAAVNGKQIYGAMPDLAEGSADLGGDLGVLVPTIAVEQYAATLAQWFGVPEYLLPKVLPHIDQFSVKNLGFMSV